MIKGLGHALSRRRRIRSFSTSISLPVVSSKRRNIIFGANTDVGKTIVSAGLCRASSAHHETHYIKPLQCGGSDESFVENYAVPQSTTTPRKHLVTHTLFSWDTPASPHTACKLEQKPVSDEQVLTMLRERIVEIANGSTASTTVTTYIETAGGVLSPSSASSENQRPKHAMSSDKWGWQCQADLYQPLLGTLPVVLVGDGRLGGISCTLSALESLIIRGYDIAALVILEHEGVDNYSALYEYATRKLALRSGSGDALFSSPKHSIIALPPIPSDPRVPLDDWYASDEVADKFQKLNGFLQSSWQGQVADLKSMRSSGAKVVWWPFTQHGNLDDDSKITHIDSASGDDFVVLKQSVDDTTNNKLVSVPMFDACASWWTQGVGHGESSMALAAAAAAGRYGHVIFPETVHAPVVSLSQKLIGPDGPGHGWASRVFFTDDGSTAVEVAIKMAHKLYQKRMDMTQKEREKWKWAIVAQEDCYHGDTLGAMNVAEESIFNEGQHPWYESKGFFLSPPTLGFEEGKLTLTIPEGWEPDDEDGVDFSFDTVEQIMDIDARMISRRLYTYYLYIIEVQWMFFEQIHSNTKLGAILIEPILLGAGGMKWVDPLWQRALADVGKKRGIPVVFDEVASGLHRVGVNSCKDVLGVSPDISCYAKLLTGGLLPMSVTLATEETFESFLGDEKSQALLHGHSYTAHPVGCVGALHALDAYKAVVDDDVDLSSPRMSFDIEQAKELSRLPLVERAFALGTVLSVTIKPKDDAGSGYAASSQTIPIVKKLREQGIYARPLGNVVYIMASPLTSKAECARVTSILHKTIEDFEYHT
jgi:dethiobiotin synthetase/adenosylmethionine--8-amino-7-oxononanoate aminotransferase